jgi:ATP-dependent RNA circularization protein (DNA/RNA ligase family)
VQYPKINSLWKRDPITKRLLQGEYSCPEFGNISQWRVDEKIDGTNIQIEFLRSEPSQVQFLGRTKDAMIPPHLLKYLTQTFTADKLEKAFPDAVTLRLFGEGYGAKIQAAGPKYREDVGFILFDVWIGGWWIQRNDVHEIAKRLEIPSVPNWGVMDEFEIVELVESRTASRCSAVSQVMEGVVCRPEPLMLFRDKSPIIWKLKCRDFDLEAK